MLRIVISRSVYDRTSRSFGRSPVATFEVDGNALRLVAGDPTFPDPRNIVLIDPVSGEDLTFDENPNLWARELPTAFHHGDLIAETVHVAASAPHREHDAHTYVLPARAPA